MSDDEEVRPKLDINIPAWFEDHVWVRPYDEASLFVQKARMDAIKDLDGSDSEMHEWPQHVQDAFVNAHNHAWRQEIMAARAAGYKRNISRMYEELSKDDATKQAPSQMKRGRGRPPATHYFLTINPAPETDTREFLNAVIDAVAKGKYPMRAVLEQRGQTEADRGHGMHAHVLLKVKEGEETSNMKTWWYTRFQRFCGNPKHLYWIPITDEQGVRTRWKYMSGDKAGRNAAERLIKQQRCEQDTEWRNANNIAPDYVYDPHAFNIPRGSEE